MNRSQTRHRNAWHAASFSYRAGLAYLLVVVLSLSACGGGGSGGVDGGSTSPPVIDPPVDVLADAARFAKLTATYRFDIQQVTLQWMDTFATESGFRVERQSDTGWVLVDLVPASNGTGAQRRWVLSRNSGVTFRVLAIVGERLLPLSTISDSAQLTVPARDTPPSLTTSTGEPLQGQVTLGLANPGPSITARFSADYAVLGPTLDAAPFVQAWDSASVSNGNHLLQVAVQWSADVVVDVRRLVSVSNPVAPAGIDARIDAANSGGQTLVQISAGSDVGIASVQIFVDGQAAGTMSRPSQCVGQPTCSPPAPPALWIYNFTLSDASYANGVHMLTALVTDNNGVTARPGLAVMTNALPNVTLLQPVDGLVVSNGRLRVTGSVTDDTGEVDVAITFASLPVMRTGAGSFDIDFDTSGLINGNYGLTIAARDRQGAIGNVSRQIWVQAGSPAPQLVAPLGVSNRMFAVDGDSALVGYSFGPDDGSLPPGAEIRERVLTGAGATLRTVFLQQEVENTYGVISLSAGRVLSGGKGDDSGDAYNIYLWGVNGVRRNLSKEAGVALAFQEYPVIAGDWVAWYARTVGIGREGYAVYNLSTHQVLTLPVPAGMDRVGNIGTSIMTKGADAKFFYWAGTGTSVVDSAYGIYAFDTATRSTQRISPPGVRDLYPQTDGQRVAWRRVRQGSVTSPFDLWVAPASDTTAAQMVASDASAFELKDGLLAWVEGTGTSNAIRASDASATYLVSNKLDARLMASGGGAVAFSQGGKLWVWAPLVGTRLVLDSMPVEVKLTQGWLYLTTGNGRALHRIPL